MAFNEHEVKYLEENRRIFETEDLGYILNTMDKSIQSNVLTRSEACKLAFFSAMAIDSDSIILTVVNRGKSRSASRANAGQKIFRVYYGVEDEDLVAGPNGSGSTIEWVPGPVKIFKFTFFKGTLNPNDLERLLLKPLLDYNRRMFGKEFESLTRKMMSKIDWSNI